MLPKKGRKEITVDNVLYHYVVKEGISVIIRNSVTGEIIKWYEECKPKWQIQIKPHFVKKIIQGKDVRV